MLSINRPWVSALLLEGGGGDVQPEVAYRVGGFGLHAWEILDGCDGLLAAEVDHYGVGEWGAFYGTPVG